jgi:hypothetical protein
MPPQAGSITRLLLQPVEIALRHGRRSASSPSSWVQRQQPSLVSSEAALATRFSSSMARTTRLRFHLNSMNPYKPRQRISPKSFYSTKPETKSPSLSQRLKSLSREYGWSALGVYLALTVLDFPFCFAAVRYVGVERIGHLEHVVIEGAKDVLRSVWPIKSTPGSPSGAEVEHEATTHADGHGVLEEQKNNSGEGASPWPHIHPLNAFFKVVTLTLTCLRRYIDPACPGVRNSQELHLHSGAVDCGRHPQSCEDAEKMGLGYRQKNSQEHLGSSELMSPARGVQSSRYPNIDHCLSPESWLALPYELPGIGSKTGEFHVSLLYVCIIDRLVGCIQGHLTTSSSIHLCYMRRLVFHNKRSVVETQRISLGWLLNFLRL